jgi:ketosteroid isomerase-like protein
VTETMTQTKAQTNAEARGVAGPLGEAAGNDWPARFLKEADTLDIDRLTACFADDIEVRFGNADAIHGKPAARAAFVGFWSTIRGMRHQPETVVRADDLASQQSIVTYTTLDGRDISVPVASHLRRTPEGLLNRLWIFIDLAPLFAPAP